MLNIASNDPLVPEPVERPASSGLCAFSSTTDSKQIRAQLLGDIAAFCRIHRNAIGGLTGRAIARIFHGLTSPQYPAYEWSRDPCWGRHTAADFNLILSLANKTVEAMRRKRAAQDKADAADMATKAKRARSKERNLARAVEREGEEHVSDAAGAVLVCASDSEEEDAGATDGTGDDVHAATSLSISGEAAQDANGGEEYDSEEL